MGRFYGDMRIYYYPEKKENPYKIIFFKEYPRPEYAIKNNDDEKEKIKIPEGEKLMNNIIRVKSKIRDYAFCNQWDYFVTLTFSLKNINRYDLKEIKKKLGKYFDNYKQRKNSEFKYLLVPEYHEDGAIHFHGLVKNINQEDLHEFEISERLPVYILDQIKKGLKVYDWYDFHYKFGYTTLEPIRNSDAACNYISKYVTKELVSLPLGTCCYLSSKGLKVPDMVHEDYGGLIPKRIDFENEFMCIKWIKDMSCLNEILMNV